MKNNLPEITEDDLILKAYEWTKSSPFAITDSGILIFYDGLRMKEPMYWCLYEGYWDISDACAIGYGVLADARPIEILEASEIIRKEAKDPSTRPLDCPRRNFSG
jgi:hypothetical protein